MSNDNLKEYVCVGLFAGAGGLDLGFKQAGFEVKLAVEIDEDASKTYQLNNPNTIVWNKDIADVDGKEIRKIVGDKKIVLLGGHLAKVGVIFKMSTKTVKKD
ncbi:DNA cytosine methyltransferase [Anaerobacillus isosaccharinicus]|uniref:DNA cytosine methyltransferase n=1 Tax=Anaerobacillus isosaccharinicus TaxID=1532552 RepID=A0AC62A3Z2_9BACI|nr:DNA cytosine methyltransferase [Anaerobacillus isosaccharinicus]